MAVLPVDSQRLVAFASHVLALQRITVAIEIKGLAGSVQRARAAIKDVRGAIADLDDETRALHRTVEEIGKQVAEVHSDLKFEAENLGNSDGGAETPLLKAIP